MSVFFRPPFFQQEVCENTYKINNSCMLNGVNQSLTRITGGGGSLTSFTISFWIKKTDAEPGSGVVQKRIFRAEGVGQEVGILSFNADDKLEWLSQDSAGVLRSRLLTTAVFRDPTSWYHFVFTYDSNNPIASNRLQMYVNGLRLTVFDVATFPNLGVSGLGINGTIFLGRNGVLNNLFLSGYLADVYLVDGQSLTADSFGRFSNSLQQWIPILYNGLFGVTGIFLRFLNSANLGQDSSGGARNMTLVNINAMNQYTDTPSDNYCTFNTAVLSPNVTYQNGGTGFQVQLTATCVCTYGVSRGKWYWEGEIGFGIGGSGFIGITSISDITGTPLTVQYNTNGTRTVNGVTTAYGLAYGTPSFPSDVIGVALNMDAGTIEFFRNGVSQGIAASGLSGTYYPFANKANATALGNVRMQFGSRPFTYTPPLGFDPLSTVGTINELGDPDITDPRMFFMTFLYSGNGVARNFSDFRFQPDVILLKSRTNTQSWRLVNSVRGATLALRPDIDAGGGSQEITELNGVTAFLPNGFSLGNDPAYNAAGQDYIAYVMRRSITSGIDIVTYTGAATAQTIPHGLGSTPQVMWVKALTLDNNFAFYHASVNATPQNASLLLNAPDALQVGVNFWNSTLPTNNNFTVGPNAITNSAGNNYIAFLFSEIMGFSKFGFYVGNGNLNGTFFECGFRPSFVLIKSMLNQDYTIFFSGPAVRNPAQRTLAINNNAAELAVNLFDAHANGFKLRNTTFNATGVRYIVMAFAEYPFNNKCAVPALSR